MNSINNSYLRYNLAVRLQGSESKCFMGFFEILLDRLNFLDLETLLYSN